MSFDDPIFNYNNNANGDERNSDVRDGKKAKKEKKGLGRFFSKKKTPSHSYMLEIPDEQQYSRLQKSKSLEMVVDRTLERRTSEPERESKSSAFGKLFGKKSKRDSIQEEDRIPKESQTKEEQIPLSMERASSLEYSPAEFLPAEPMFYAMADSTSQPSLHHTTTEAQTHEVPVKKKRRFVRIENNNTEKEKSAASPVRSNEC